MVLYFTSNVVSPPYLIYVGEDKHENEELIRWGWPEDVWFHVDKMSSAHVYLRLRAGETIDDIPEAVIQDCAQLVKANSIQGCKANDVDVVYTMWSNLKKTPEMDVGQVGFHRQKEVKSLRVEKKVNEIVNRLNKTCEEEARPASRERGERSARTRGSEGKGAGRKETSKGRRGDKEARCRTPELHFADEDRKHDIKPGR